MQLFISFAFIIQLSERPSWKCGAVFSELWHRYQAKGESEQGHYGTHGALLQRRRKEGREKDANDEATSQIHQICKFHVHFAGKVLRNMIIQFFYFEA